jgi:glycosyltransferase involved in cell wall biosynthesis
MLAASGGGRVVPPDDLPAFVDALRSMLADAAALAAQGEAARRWVEQAASPRAVAQAYATLIERL